MGSSFSYVNEDLLVKYLLGEASTEEQEEVRKWVGSSEANRKQFEHFKLLWDESHKIAAASTINVDDAWSRFRQRTKQAEVPETTVIALPGRFGWLKAAASIILIAGVGWLAYTLGTNNPGKMMAISSGNSVFVDTLPDGSVITLNRNSSLTYNGQLDGDIRSVKLQGEAFFNVAPDKVHPFVIDVNGATVTVVGTSFNVKSTEGKTEVIVATGIVDVAKNQNAVRLKPNEKATVLATRDAPIKGSSEDELYNYYKTRELVCRETPLTRLVEVLSEAYGVDIVIENDRLEYQKISTTFRGDSLEEVFDVLERQYNIQAIKQGNRIVLQ